MGLLILSGLSLEQFSTTRSSAASQTQLIPTALWRNVPPRADWANGTLYHLTITKHFIPIDIRVINDLSSLESYRILLVHRLLAGDGDIRIIADWVRNGGVLVWIGQSGRMRDDGTERLTHPLGEVLGVDLNSWEKRSGEDLGILRYERQWLWWSIGDTYSAFMERSLIADVSVKSSDILATMSDVNNEYAIAAITRNSFGAGKAYFFSGEFFWRNFYTSAIEGVGIAEDSMRPEAIKGLFYALWLNFLAIILENFETVPVLQTLPYDLRAATGFHMHAEGSRSHEENEENDDLLYSNLIDRWTPQLFDLFPQLKGFFWQFQIVTNLIDGTSSRDSILEFMLDYGVIGSHTHSHKSKTIEDWVRSIRLLKSLNLEYRFSTDWPAGGQGINLKIGDVYRVWNSEDILGLFAISGGATPSPAPGIPFPFWNKTSPIVKEWSLAVPREGGVLAQKTYGEFGLGGMTLAVAHDWDPVRDKIFDVIRASVDDPQTWKVNDVLLMEWWLSRWAANITGFAVSEGGILIDLTTPEISGLSILLWNIDGRIVDVLIDDSMHLGYYPQAQRVIIPHLTAGNHRLDIKIGVGNVRVPNLASGYEQGHLGFINNLTRAEYDASAGVLDLSIWQKGTKRLVIDTAGLGKPSHVVADGTPLSEGNEWTYSNALVTLNLSFDSAKQILVRWLPPQINTTTSTTTTPASTATTAPGIDQTVSPFAVSPVLVLGGAMAGALLVYLLLRRKQPLR